MWSSGFHFISSFPSSGAYFGTRTPLHGMYRTVVLFLHNYIPSPNQKSAALWGNDDVIDDEIDDETYDEIAVKTASKCFAHMKDCWDPELEPSVEEIVDYRWYLAILSVLWGDFPVQSR